MKSRVLSSAIVGLVGAIIGSFSMMLYASTHFAGIAAPGGTPPVVEAAPIAAGTSDQDRIVNAVKRVGPSVVAINVSINGQRYVPVDPFGQFFGGGSAVRPQRFREQVSGSGFVYSRDGEIVTNAHVVTGGFSGTPSKIEVVFANNERRQAHLVAANLGVDLAVIKVDNYDKLPPALEIADSSKLQSGQWAIAIGEPLELKQTVTVGVISGFNRSEAAGNATSTQLFTGLLQTSAPINPGNSGGPLVDVNGRVIGVNQLTANPQQAQGIGFAIPSNEVRTVASALQHSTGILQGTNQGYIGISTAALDQSIRTQLGGYQGAGVVVDSVAPGSAADKAGLQPGDVLQSVNGQQISNPAQLSEQVKVLRPGTSVTLRVWSSGSARDMKVLLTERPASANYRPQANP